MCGGRLGVCRVASLSVTRFIVIASISTRRTYRACKRGVECVGAVLILKRACTGDIKAFKQLVDFGDAAHIRLVCAFGFL